MALQNHQVPLFSRRHLSFFVFFLCIFIVAFLVYYSNADNHILFTLKSRYSLEEMTEFAIKRNQRLHYRNQYYHRRNLSFDRIISDPSSHFRINKSDVLVVIHIQKTAGTSFERFLVRHLILDRPCQCPNYRKRCTCLRPGQSNINEQWLFSRFSTGWICGLHADYTELVVSGCVDNVLDKMENSVKKRRYFYATFLRDPVARFVSEFRHVNRGATWSRSRLFCGSGPPTPVELPHCFDPTIGWSGVSLDDFLACPFNLAANRQTRMLADLTLVGCYDRTVMSNEQRGRLMLASAKKNLQQMAFFGLTERISDSQFMFERIFLLNSSRRLDSVAKRRSKSNDTVISDRQMAAIRLRNTLDIELYAFAKALFERRFRRLSTQGRNDDLEQFKTRKLTPLNVDTFLAQFST